MSTRKPRTPGTTVRRDTVRRRLAAKQWADETAYVKEGMASRAPHTPRSELVTTLSGLAHLYRDPVLYAAVERLRERGLGGPDWRAVADQDRGMWNGIGRGAAVELVDVLLAKGLTLEAACEQVAAQTAQPSQSFDGAVEWVKRTYQQWRDVPEDERRPADAKEDMTLKQFLRFTMGKGRHRVRLRR